MEQEQFRMAAGISAGLAVRWFRPVMAAMEEFGIQTPQDQAMFIAQTGHESAGFRQLLESFNYTPEALLTTFGRRITTYQAQMLGRKRGKPAQQAAIAALVYQNRMGNRYKDDGWKYRGRGLIQITGRDNYTACGTALNLDLVSMPELLEKDTEAARSAAWFYACRGCLQCPGDILNVTLLINGGRKGLKERTERYQRALSQMMVTGESG